MEENKNDRLNEQYSQEVALLKKKSVDELKEMARLLGMPMPSGFRKKADWIEEIVSFCSGEPAPTEEKLPKQAASSVKEPHVNEYPEPPYTRSDIAYEQPRYQPQQNQEQPYREQRYMPSSNQAGNDGFRGQQEYYPQQVQRPAYNQQNTYYGEQRKKTYQQQENGGYQYNQQNYRQQPPQYRPAPDEDMQGYPQQDAGIECEYILEVMPDGYGFLRSNNYLSGANDVYVSNQQIRKYKLRTGDIVRGKTRRAQQGEKYPPLLYIEAVNGYAPEACAQRVPFDELTPIYPKERITLEIEGRSSLAVRLVDLFAPIGKGQRGLIVSQPKAGKTTLLKDCANSITHNYPDIHLIVLLIDERPEEVTDIKRSIQSTHEGQVEVIYSTFDELPDHHTKVAEMVMERSMRLVEHGRDVVVLMDSITRLARAYNITMPSTGKTLSGGMDPSALFKPKRFFGAARNIENGGSLTIIATALVETGSRMDDIVYEEFKGTGNMEIHLDRSLSEKRIFPAIDIYKSGTRHDELLLTREEFDCITAIRRTLSSNDTQEVTEQVLNMFSASKNNGAFIKQMSAWVAKFFAK